MKANIASESQISMRLLLLHSDRLRRTGIYVTSTALMYLGTLEP